MKAVFSRIYYADTHIDIKILKQAIVIDVQAGIIVLSSQAGKICAIRQYLAGYIRNVEGQEEHQG